MDTTDSMIVDVPINNTPQQKNLIPKSQDIACNGLCTGIVKRNDEYDMKNGNSKYNMMYSSLEYQVREYSNPKFVCCTVCTCVKL